MWGEISKRKKNMSRDMPRFLGNGLLMTLYSEIVRKIRFGMAI